jgi:hypothetical protein
VIKWKIHKKITREKVETNNYVSWTMEDTNEFLHLLVDVMNRERIVDAKGSLNKQNVERIILPRLNAKTKLTKNGFKIGIT